MGIGDAYLGLVDLISHNGKSPLHTSLWININFAENTSEPDSPVECLIGFVTGGTLQSIKRATDDTIATWYYAVSDRLANHS